MRPSFYPWQNDERGEFEERFGQLRTELGVQGFQYKGKQTNNITEERTGLEEKSQEKVISVT